MLPHIETHLTKLVAKKQSYRKSNGKWDRKSFRIYSTGVKNLFALLYYDLMNDSVSRVNNEKSFNGSIEMKLSWPPGWGQETQMPLQPNLTPAWAPCVSSIWSDSSRCCWGREGGTRVPWWLTRGWRFGKSTLTFDVDAPPNPPHPLRGLSLAVWPFKWPLDTVHVTHVLAVWHVCLWTAARSAAKYWHQSQSFLCLMWWSCSLVIAGGKLCPQLTVGWRIYISLKMYKNPLKIKTAWWWS